MFEKFNITGKVAIVTGGAGGIGRALAIGLAQHGADVVVTDINLDGLEPISAEIQSQGRKSLAVSSDVTDEKSVIAMVDRVMNEFAHIDVLINAAGIIIRARSENIAIADWNKIIEVNALGTFICCQKVGQVMIEQNKGKIINFSSVRGKKGAYLGASAYCPSKGAVNAMTRNMAVEWAKYNVHVNAIAPSTVHTALTDALIKETERVNTMLAHIPMNRFCEVDDLIGPTVFLASDASNFVTGQILYVDGGYTII